MNRVIKLTDQILVGLARTASFRDKFKVFKALYEGLAAPGCGKCKKRKRQNTLLPAIKQEILKSPKLVQAIKQQLHASTLVIFVRKGKTIVKETL